MQRIGSATTAVRRARIVLAVAVAGLVTMGASATFAESRPLQSAGPAGASLPVAPGVISYVVNTTDDVDDGTCDFAHCSLREAVESAAYEQGPHVIMFDIPTSDPGYDPSTGVWTIQPTNGFTLPADVTIDGYVGSTPEGGIRSVRPGIEIDGTTLAALGVPGLRLSNDVTLRGLIITRFQYGIWVTGNNAVIEGCYVGTDPTGTQAKPNTLAGILVGSGARNGVIQQNLISGNSGIGIRLYDEETSGNTISDNRIGTDLDGSGPLPNKGHGVYFHAGAHDNTVGPDNLIAYNQGAGVGLDGQATRGNTITRNRIHSNTTTGIVLSTGANGGVAPPVITGASVAQVTGTACPGCTIEVFSDVWNQGAVYEGSTTADSGGNWALTPQASPRGPYITTVATDGEGNTSEFSVMYELPRYRLWLAVDQRGG